MQLAKVSWRDSQPYSENFQDVYFSRAGGRAETEHVFLRNNELPQRWLNLDKFVIGETGFGTGLNFLVTANAWLMHSQPDACLYFFSAEKYPLSRTDLMQAMSAWPEFSDLATQILHAWPSAISGFHYLEICQRRVVLILMLGDVLDMLRQMLTKVDAWYLDGFAPACNPDMWSPDVCNEIARSSHAQTTFSTYTAVGDVRRNLTDAGFVVEKVKGFASKREMLRGKLRQAMPPCHVSPWFALPLNHYASKKAAVIGAGMAGMTTAWSLEKRGWQVDIIDSHLDIAMSGSGNPAGVLLPRIAAADSGEAEFYAAAFYFTLRQLSGLQTKYPALAWNQTGVVQLLSSERLRNQFAGIEQDSDYVQALSASQASALSGIRLEGDALFYPDAGWLEPRSLCETLLRDTGSGVSLKLNQQVKYLAPGADGWTLADVNRRSLGNYQVVILANAHHARDYEQTAWMNIQPARGQITYLPGSASSQNLLCPVCYDGYVLPAMHGQHVVGASFVAGTATTVISQPEHEQNLQKLQHSVPALYAGDVAMTGIQVAGRAAVRAVTPDRMPIVGAVPDMAYFIDHYSDLQKGRPATKYQPAQSLPGLFVNSGHGARGLTSVFLSAELLAAMVTNDVLPVSSRSLHALHPARFFIRQSKKGKLPVA